jgi:glutamate/tyrosine decarboxylase-like PLP-dependent enzyme
MPAWVEDPVMRDWRGSKRVRDVLDQVNTLYHVCIQSQQGAFNPFSDPLWVSTVAVMREVGLPLYNNNINLPEEIDESWPFHFKELERLAVVSKAERVGDSDPSGYVCNRYEANLYGIRAIQQELRKQAPGRQPILLASRFDPVILQYAAQLLGIDYIQLAPDWTGTTAVAKAAALLADDGSRPIIFAATLANDAGQSDDFEAVRRLATTRDVFVHVDSARSFDYLTTLSDSARRGLGLPKLILSHPKAGKCSPRPGFIYAASIVAGGMSHTRQHPTVAIKPRMLGDCVGRRIEYTQGHDSTISGSRDALGPLLIGLQEQRFDHQRRQDIYQGCMRNRAHIALALASVGTQVSCPPESLDLIIHSPVNLLQPESSLMAAWLSKLGFIHLGNDSSGGASAGAWLGTVQPSITTSHFHLLTEALGGIRGRDLSVIRELPAPPTSAQQYPLPSASHAYLSQKMRTWRKQLADSAGYPFNQATYSALGPVAAHFLDLTIPNEWVQAKAAAILRARKVSFGIPDADADLLSQFGAAFTTGSSMGNQIGVHAALAYAPDNFIYCSASSHYSVSKALGDSDVLARRWVKQLDGSDGHVLSLRPQFAIIAVDAAGRMVPSELARQVAEDRAACAASGHRYGVTLVVNVGTTFVGGVDDIAALRGVLREDVEQEVSYIHADGALDFGFGPGQAKLVCLGPPDGPSVRGDGVPVVQGITVSHHKAYGMMVSGEVVYYNPSHNALPNLAPAVDPRAVFEAWLFQQMYSDDDLAMLRRHCLANANALRSMLSAAGIFVLRNQTSLIVVLERPAPWVLVDFHLRAEGNCVHYICMPHITLQAIDRFARAVISLDECYNAAFQQAKLAFSTAVRRTSHLVRIRTHASHFPAVEAFVKSPETVLSCCDADNSASPSVSALEAGRQSLRSALSVAILDVQHGPVAVLLARGSSQKGIHMSQMLLHRSVIPMGKQIWSIAQGMFEEISTLV